MHTRRDFLKQAIALSGAAGFTGFVPEAIQRAFAIDPTPGSSYLDAEHIVILMQENRSFDHALGTLQGVRGFNDPRAIKLENGNPVWLQTNAAGETYAPFRLNIKDTQATWMGSLPHSRDSQVDAWNTGLYDQWLTAKHLSRPNFADIPFTLGYYTREDIPFYYALADAFTVCDQHFSGVLASTTPNRMMFWTGTLREQQNSSSKANLSNDDYTNGGAHWATIPESLQQNNVSWKFYQNEISVVSLDGLSEDQDTWLSNFGCNPLEQFAQYNVEFSKSYIANLPNQIAKLNADIKRLQDSLNSSNPRTLRRIKSSLAEKQQTLEISMRDLANNQGAFEKLPEAAQELHLRAFVTNEKDSDYRDLVELDYMDGDTKRNLIVPKGDILHQFRQDVQNGKLPTVSWLAAPERFSDHPSSPWFGAWYVSEVMDILTKNPEVWKKTIFILTYDENDGYFDHVPPFVAPDPRNPATGRVSPGLESEMEYAYRENELQQGVTEQAARTAPIGLGYRVPMIVASPWSRGGWVNSQVFDHTSTNQFLEHFLNAKFGCSVREKNMTDWRRAISGDLTTIFRPFNGEKLSPLPFLDRDAFVESIHKAKFKEPPSDFSVLTAAQIAGINQDPMATDLITRQEPGIRPSCALPYQLYVDGALSPDANSFALKFRSANEVFGKLAAGSPFNVYMHGLKQPAAGAKVPQAASAYMHSASYSVAAGDILQEQFALESFIGGAYRIAVYGPNGFMREFAGDKNDPGLHIACEYETHPGNPKKLTGNITLAFIHAGKGAPCKLEIIDHAYGAKPLSKTIQASGGAQRNAVEVLDLKKSHGWYDFSVKVDGFPLFSRRYAGRVETGSSSYSDPFMGMRA